MTDKRRKGSLGWYNNCKKSLRSLYPVHTKTPHMYFIKVGMQSQIVDNKLTPITLLEPITHIKKQKKEWIISLSETKSKFVRRKDVVRQINTEFTTHEELLNYLLNCKKFDIIGLTKGRGTLGPVQRRNIKMQKRKAAGSGVARKPGSMGTRIPGKIPYTKPFSGKTGFARRTITGLKNLGLVSNTENTKVKKYCIKSGNVLSVKGSVPGPIGRVLCVRSSMRV